MPYKAASDEAMQEIRDEVSEFMEYHNLRSNKEAAQLLEVSDSTLGIAINWPRNADQPLAESTIRKIRENIAKVGESKASRIATRKHEPAALTEVRQACTSLD